MKRKLTYNNIMGLHLELTTKCNAMCPMCNRNFKGKVRKDLPILELSIDDIKTILSKKFLKQLKLISLCGVYGEPICNKDLKKIISYLFESNQNINIDLYTNGSLYDDDWWRDLATITKNHNGLVIFGIDGIGETHSLHRCNTNYDKVISHAKAFIDAGGIAQWDYIVFKHNEHQVEAAKNLSEKMGFKSFQIKKTSRFFKKIYENDQNLDSTIADYGKHPVYNCNGEIIYYLELPEKKDYRNPLENSLFELVKEYGSVDKYLNEVKIDCEALKSGGIFISAEGEMFPCCTVYQQVCYKKYHNVSDEKELNEYKLYIRDNLSLFDRSIKEIVNGRFFNDLTYSFSIKNLDLGKPKSCSRACGKNLNIHASVHTTEIKYGKEN